MALPVGVSTRTLTFGPYTDLTGTVCYAGMVGILSLSEQVEDVLTGAVIDSPVTVVIGSDGMATIGPLPCNNDPALYPQGTTYHLEWQAISWKPTPGNKTFTLLTTDPQLVDYDLIDTGYTPGPSTTSALVGSALVGTATVG